MDKIITKQDALLSLRPKASFAWNEETDVISNYSSLDSTSIPTDSEIASEVTRLQTEYDNKKYQRDRAIAYPSIQDQLDMQYWDKKNGTTTWVDAVAKVKSDNPKP